MTLLNDATQVDIVTYGSAANNDEAIVRSPEVGAAATFVTSFANDGWTTGAWSPGTAVGGFGF